MESDVKKEEILVTPQIPPNFFDSGDIFISNNGSYLIICKFCENPDKFDEIASFINHCIEHITGLRSTVHNLSIEKEIPNLPENQEETIYRQIKTEQEENLIDNFLKDDVPNFLLQNHTQNENFQSITSTASNNNTNSKETFKCCTCHIEFASKKCLNGHMHDHKEILGKSERLKNSSTSNKSYSHETDVKNADPCTNFDENETFKCDICDKAFPARKNLYGHMKAHKNRITSGKLEILVENSVPETNSPSPDNFECLICNKKFDTKNGLRIHNHMHIIDNDWDCCGKIFPSRYHFNVHWNSTHVGRFECEICNKFVWKKWFESHMEKHNETFECQLCSQIFKDKAMFVDHTKMHSKERRKCGICKKTFSRIRLRKLHERFIHKDKFSFMCEMCGKPFKRSQDFKSHLIIHSKDASFTCKVCAIYISSKDTQTGVISADTYS